MYFVLLLLLVAMVVKGQEKSTVQCAYGVRFGRVTERWAAPALVALGGAGLPFSNNCSELDLEAAQQVIACPQEPTLGAPWRSRDAEQCLLANVWVPSESTEDLRPVLVWFYGGSYVSGSIGNPLYDGTRLSGDGGVIVVAFNYRLGALGWAGFRNELDGSVGNYGLMDAELALQWLHQELIPRIHGDPTRVTVFGESAGGGLVCSLLASARIDGQRLFSGAIMESGVCQDARDVNTATERATALLANLNCSTVACARAAPWKSVIQAQSKLARHHLLTPFGPAVDQVWLNETPADRLYLHGLHPGSAVRSAVVGTNTNESAYFTLVAAKTRSMTESQLRSQLLAFFNGSTELVDQSLALYPLDAPAPPPGPGEPPVTPAAYVWTRMLTDLSFTCPAHRVAWGMAVGGVSQQSSKRAVPVYVYVDQFVPQCSYRFLPRAWLPVFGAFHSSELPYVFGNRPNPTCKLSANGLALSAQLRARWTGFATTFQPQAAGYTQWPPVRDGPQSSLYNQTALLLSNTMTYPTDSFRGKKCAFWDKFSA